MIVLLMLVIVFCFGIYLALQMNDLAEISGFIIAVLSGAMLAFALLWLPIAHLQAPAQVARYTAFKESLDRARATGLSIERAAIEHDIIEMNKDIAEWRYWNSTMFDIFVPDELAEREYLK